MTPERIAQLEQMLERGTICKGHIAEMLDAIKQRQWVGLTVEEIDYLYIEHRGDGGPTAICEQFATAFAAYLKKKNT